MKTRVVLQMTEAENYISISSMYLCTQYVRTRVYPEVSGLSR